MNVHVTLGDFASQEQATKVLHLAERYVRLSRLEGRVRDYVERLADKDTNEIAGSHERRWHDLGLRLASEADQIAAHMEHLYQQAGLTVDAVLDPLWRTTRLPEPA